MARLPNPTMAHPNFLPGESGAATSFVTASFKNAPATLAATKLWLTLTMNPRRESSFPEESFMIFSPSLGTALLPNFFQPLLQIILIFLLQFRVGRSGINLARLVLHFVKLLFCPFIMNADFIRAVEYFLYQLGRNEIYALAVTHDQITGHHGNAANSYRNIDARQHHVSYGRWINSPEISGHSNLRDSVEIPNAPIDD